MKKHAGRIVKIASILIMTYLIILMGGFFGIKKGLTNTAGMVDDRSGEFNRLSGEIPDDNKFPAGASREKMDAEKAKILCEIDAIGAYAPINAEKIARTYQKTGSDGLVNKMIFAVEMRFSDKPDFGGKISACPSMNSLTPESLAAKYADFGSDNAFPWMNDEEWIVIGAAVDKDKDVINQVSRETQLPPRLIVSSLIVEQLRLFHSQRELFKKVFEPLKILGNATKISLGVMGIKEATAIEIERHLKDPASEYYLGKSFENNLDFSTSDPVQERFERLTRENDHYYSYLYAALYMKQMMSQWEKAGYDIRYRPEIIGTLFNVGFPQSKPKPDPKTGGSEISIKEAKYSFGSLAYEFYYSGEMQESFPYVTE
jgi:hypothetical protein